MKAKGFTLIELVVVIVILGILSVTAAPRFLNLQDDARNAAIAGLRGAMNGAMGIVYGKAALMGVERAEEAKLDTDGTGTLDLAIAYGYPKATLNDLSIVVQGLREDWAHKEIPGSASIHFGIAGYDKACIKYTQAGATSAATAMVIKDPAECSGLTK